MNMYCYMYNYSFKISSINICNSRSYKNYEPTKINKEFNKVAIEIMYVYRLKQIIQLSYKYDKDNCYKL